MNAMEDDAKLTSEIALALISESVNAQVHYGRAFTAMEDHIFRLGFARGVMWANARAVDKLDKVIQQALCAMKEEG
jgi:hypothetical protein